MKLELGAVCKRKREIKKMIMVIGVLFCFVGGIMLYFSLPCSKTRTEFISSRDSVLFNTTKAL